MNILQGIIDFIIGAAERTAKDTDRKMTNYVKDLSDEQLQKAAITSKGKGGEKYVQAEMERRNNRNK